MKEDEYSEREIGKWRGKGNDRGRREEGERKGRGRGEEGERKERG